MAPKIDGTIVYNMRTTMERTRKYFEDFQFAPLSRTVRHWEEAKFFDHTSNLDEEAQKLHKEFESILPPREKEPADFLFLADQKRLKTLNKSLEEFQSKFEQFQQRRTDHGAIYVMYFSRKIKGPKTTDHHSYLPNFEPAYLDIAQRIAPQLLQLELGKMDRVRSNSIPLLQFDFKKMNKKSEGKRELLGRVAKVICTLFDSHYLAFEDVKEFDDLSRRINRLLAHDGFGRYLEKGDDRSFEALLNQTEDASTLLKDKVSQLALQMEKKSFKVDVRYDEDCDSDSTRSSSTSSRSSTNSSRSSTTSSPSKPTPFLPKPDQNTSFNPNGVTPKVILRDLRKLAKEESAELKEFDIRFTEDDWRANKQDSGAYGEVAVWSPPGSNSLVALKKVTNYNVKRYVRELRVWRSLKHPHICELLGFGIVTASDSEPCTCDPDSDEGCAICNSPERIPVFVAEFFPDRTVHNLLAGDDTPVKGIDRATQDSIIFGLCSAITYMHSSSESKAAAIHGDINPTNILMKAGKPYLCDFGLSHLTDGYSGLTTSSHGSTRWNAPELISGRAAPVTSIKKPVLGSDVFSLILVIIAVRTQKFPWNDFKDWDMTNTRSNKSEQSEIPPELDELAAKDDDLRLFFERCLHEHPGVRPPVRLVEARLRRLHKEGLF